MEDKVKEVVEVVYKALAAAFGGYSQVPYETIGAALYGHLTNGEFMHRIHQHGDLAMDLVDAVTDHLTEYWDLLWNEQLEVHAEIMRGLLDADHASPSIMTLDYESRVADGRTVMWKRVYLPLRNKSIGWLPGDEFDELIKNGGEAVLRDTIPE